MSITGKIVDAKEVVLIGYGGHGYVAADILQLSGYKIIGYCDTVKKVENPFSLTYLGTESEYFENNEGKQINFFAGVGIAAARKKIHHLAEAAMSRPVNAIHPKAIVAGAAFLGSGILVAANATINPMCKIGDGVICNTSSSIDHECTIGNFTHICPGTILCGNVTVGDNCFIGANSVVIPGIRIGNNVTVGAGSVVVNDLPDNGLFYGNPARRKK